MAHTAGSCQSPAEEGGEPMSVARAAAEGSARTGSPCTGSPVPGSPAAPIATGLPARAGGRQVDPAVRRTGPGRGQHRRRCGQEAIPEGQRWGRRCPGAAGPGSGAGSPRAPRVPLSPQRSPSFVPLSNRRSRPIAIEPAGPAARWLAGPPAALCQSRRPLLPQTKAAALATALRCPRPPRVLRGSGPLAAGQLGTYHLRCAPQHGGGTTKRRREKWRKRAGEKLEKRESRSLFYTKLSVWVCLAGAKRHVSPLCLIFFVHPSLRLVEAPARAHPRSPPRG